MVGIVMMASGEQPDGNVIIGLETAWKADVRLSLNPQTLRRSGGAFGAVERRAGQASAHPLTAMAPTYA
ncbi:hypothetical protein BOSEA31B_20435 [Hyphomicrobiales bacterium]|nr:hypothetical protein BOSEA31B_20435 [Hyphomicrobiales bacterium]CAH1702190.1 hypothetical protein BOSEA1005_30062 [Hyphomicrobiales bacterium]CAI0346394.1 hypothetical protein BO1005MUT1_510035 [Hyphomicrobiales bacterium]